MSIQGVMSSRTAAGALERQFTLLGWYERPSARYFDDATVRASTESARIPSAANTDGVWRFTPITMHTQRVTAGLTALRPGRS